jgi:hypothetical protein
VSKGREQMAQDQYAQRDPRSQYPRPGRQESREQSHPGTGERMDPRPDHGEESYRGCNRLVDRKTVITGADSGIGRAVALAFAREGADVLLSYMEQEEADVRQAGRPCWCLVTSSTRPSAGMWSSGLSPSSAGSTSW